MNILKKIILLCMFTLGFVHLCYAEVILDTSFVSQIKDIMAKPMKIYELDIEARNIAFKKIDDWFGSQIDYKKAVKFDDKNSGRIIYRLSVAENTPITLPGQFKKGVKPAKAFYIFYIVNKNMRSFIKQIHSASDMTLPDSVIVELGRIFLLKSGFYDLSNKDKIMNPEVMSQKRESWDVKDEGSNVMFQRVLFRREFMGAEVLNSRQIVRFHPETRELLSYKTICWTPVDESSGKEAEYMKVDDVLAQIKDFGGESKSKYYVMKIKHGFYQTETQMVPAIQAFIQPEGNITTGIAEMRRLTISLVQGIELIKKIPVDIKPEKIK